MMRRIIPLTLFGFLIFSVTPAIAAVVTIDEDTTIDASNPISGSGIEVINGSSGATIVDILSGGIVQGFHGRQGSQIILNGGNVSFLSSLSDNSTFVLRDGQFGCDIPVCQVSDYDAELTASDSSTLRFFGGVFDGIVRLNDMSFAHFYGHNLELIVFDQSFAAVEGTYLDGTPVQVAFHFRPDINSHIVLHNVPEPGSIAGVATLLCCLICFWRRRRHLQA
jgi:hypothetical protein